MAVAGDIAAEARTQIPVTWDALGSDRRYGEPFLQRKVDLVKYQLFGTVISPAQETATYSPTVIEYAGKLVALKVIPAGADYWATQKTTDASGNRTNATWLDRVDKLWELHGHIKTDLAVMQDEIQELIGTVIPIRRRRSPVGVTIGRNADYLTSNPDDFARQYEATED